MRAKTSRRIAGLAAAALLSACVVMGCGGGGGDQAAAPGGSGKADPGLRQARAAIAAARKPPKFTAPGPAFDAKAASGKRVTYIANTLSIDFTKTISGAVKDALAQAGVQTNIVDNKASVAETGRLVDQAIAQKVDAIVIQSQPTKLVRQTIMRAKAAHIPVVQLFEGDPALPTPEQKALGAVAYVSYCYTCGGKLMADWAAVDSGGKFHGVVYTSSDVGVSEPLNQGVKVGASQACAATCGVDIKDVLVADWATRIPTMTSSDLKSQPDYLMPNYDGMITFMAPSIKAAGESAKGVKVISFNSDKPYMQMLQKHDTVAALVGSPVVWAGWAIADQTLRVLTGQGPVADEKVPLRVFDDTNIKTVDLTAPEGRWYGTDFQSEYRKLWRLG
jgi:ribose transport system substrate-binding protein